MSEQPQNRDRSDDAFESHEAALRRSQAWEALAQLYARRIAAPELEDAPTERGRLHEKRGRVLERQLHDASAAIEAYQQAAQLAPQDPGPLRRLRALYEERGDHAMVLQIAEAELARTQEPERRARLLEDTARVWETQLGDAEQAALLRRRAAAEHAEVSETLEATAERPAEASPHGSITQQAWLAAARGQSAEAIGLLHTALSQDPDDIECIDMLITVLEGSERHAESAEWLERRAALADGETRAAVLMRLAAVREDLGDLNAARSACEQALSEAPRIVGARAVLLRLYRATEAWSRMRLTLEEWGSAGRSDERIDALLTLGELLESRFEDPDAAARSYQQVLDLDPEDARAQQAVEQLGPAPASSPRRPEAHSPDPDSARDLRVLGVLQRKLESLEADERARTPESVQLRLRIAELQSESLDASAAIETLEPLLDSEVALDAVAGELARLYEQAGHFEPLSELANRMAAQEQGPERTRWLYRAGSVARAAGRSDLAIACFERILSETPNDPDAERALQDLYRARGSTGPLVASLRRSLARANAEGERRLHMELAAHLEGPLDDAPGALIHLTRAIVLDPADLETLERGLAVAGLLGGDLAQLDLLDQVTSGALEPTLRAQLLARRATHLADRLGWQPEAMAGWYMARALDPECAEARDRLGER